jgi:hypothetical protein
MQKSDAFGGGGRSLRPNRLDGRSDMSSGSCVGVIRVIAPRRRDAPCWHQQGRTARGHLAKGHVARTAKAPALRQVHAV